MLLAGDALVLEGGGTRGFFSAGVFDAFMDAGIMFPYIVAVSVGAANALSYIPFAVLNRNFSIRINKQKPGVANETTPGFADYRCLLITF